MGNLSFLKIILWIPFTRYLYRQKRQRKTLDESIRRYYVIFKFIFVSMLIYFRNKNSAKVSPPAESVNMSSLRSKFNSQVAQKEENSNFLILGNRKIYIR